MSSTTSAPVGSATPVSQAGLQRDSAVTASPTANRNAGSQPAPRAGFGLPCAKCKTYYAADLETCPVCKTTERVAATAVPARAAVSVSAVSGSEETPAPEVLEAERERFLRDFKAQLLASQAPVRSAAGASCIHKENHPNSVEPAVICQSCYDHLQERVDVLEAALHMDLKEAAQIVYDAVWADPSDPAKTYENAAHALLTDLRRRSGVTLTFGLLQPLAD